MRQIYLLLLLAFLAMLTACSKPADRTLLNYEQSLAHADSLARSGAVDSMGAVRLLSDLHREYVQVKELSDGSLVRLKPANRWKRFGWFTFTALMIGLNIWLSITDFKFSKERKHRRYLLDLSENEQRLRNNERERKELEECLKEMSLTDEEREEVCASLTNLMEHGNRLDRENEQLRARLKEYEDRPVPRELAMLKQEGERVRVLDGQVEALASAMLVNDAVMARLHAAPAYLSDVDYAHLQELADRVYEGFRQRLSMRFPRLTSADLQLCLLMRLRFSNTEIATLTAVSPASVSQQKFRLKKRMMQEDEGLFDNGRTVEAVVCGC